MKPCLNAKYQNHVFNSFYPVEFTPDGVLSSLLSKLLTNVINATITKGIFPSNAKLANVKPIYKKGSRLDVSNYRPISVISAFSKVMEKYFESSMVDYINSISSRYLSEKRLQLPASPTAFYRGMKRIYRSKQNSGIVALALTKALCLSAT